MRIPPGTGGVNSVGDQSHAISLMGASPKRSFGLRQEPMVCSPPKAARWAGVSARRVELAANLGALVAASHERIEKREDIREAVVRAAFSDAVKLSCGWG